MPLTVDLPAIAHNAALVADQCRRAGLSPVGVFKEAYALPEIASALKRGGIADFVASTPAAANALVVSGIEVGALLGGSAGHGNQGPAACIHATTHIRPDTVRGALWSNPCNFAWLEVLTSDGKQGMAAETLIPFLADLSSQDRTAAGRVGLLFNWGCLEGPPGPDELRGVGHLTERAERILGRPLAISFGGSALLPILASLPRSSGPRCLRVGEAVLTGTLPAASGSSFGLLRPITLDAPVIDLRWQAGRILMLIGRGHSCLDQDEIADGRSWRVVGVATETSLIEILGGPAPGLGAVLTLHLGYRSTVRCLLNRTVARNMIESLSDDVEAA